MSALTALLSGLLFGLGLLASGMTNPSKVTAFLDVLGAWDPSLALVMGGAIAIGVLGFTLVERRQTALNGEPLCLPPKAGVDRRLVVGGLLFGVGWGLAGFCPGPALVAAASGMGDALILVVAMLVGMAAYDKLVKAQG